MIMIYYLLLIVVFYQQSPCSASRPQEKCALYKNSKFLWWGTDCGKFCHQAGKRVTCMWYQYHQGCFCKDGFYRKRNWDCVPLEGCDADTGGGDPVSRSKQKPIIEEPAECPPNELWKDCGKRCTNLCESINNPNSTACNNKKCEKGCFCKSGMLRNYNGACIRQDQCKIMMGSSSFKFKYSMSISLSLYIKKTYRYKKHCKRGKKCKGGQSNKYESIPSNQECKENEEFTTCGDTCSEQCRNLYMSENCPLKCSAGCFCKMNYYRNNRGYCVPAKKCPGYNKRKQLISTTTHKPKPLLTTTKPTPPPHNPKATYGTTSTTTIKPVRNVSDSECPVNEVWSKCGSHCEELCENSNDALVRPGYVLRIDSKCPPNMNCLEGCFCKPGLYRNHKDSCIPKDDCPPPPPKPKPPKEAIKCKVNEQYTKCGSKCSESCNVFNETLEQNCPPKCDEGCFCIQGFYRDRYKVCVPQDQCECEIPPQKCNDPKEEYSVCGKNCHQTCDDKHPECKDTCARGCVCKTGYIYNENGVCVTPDQCGMDIRNGTKEGRRKIVKPIDKCPGENEKWSTCGNICGDFCEPKFDKDKCHLTCETGCFCKKGYQRNTADKCVALEKCMEKPTCGEHEEYSDCGSNCGVRCKDVGRNRLCALTCEKGCFCKNGYFRDDNGKCIPRSKCVIDTSPECGEHEEYKNCSSHCGNTCEDLRNPVKCPKPEIECDKGCFCIPDFYRDLDASCVSKLDCNIPPPVTEEPFCEQNEMHQECGNRCDESCEDSTKCARTCEPGCFCLQDYLRNTKGKCVPSEKCKGPPQCADCKQNEYYTECGTDCGRMCTDIGKNIKCGKDSPCHPGCVCKWGFYRTPDGECVTKNECKFYLDEDTDVTTDDSEGLQSPGEKVRNRLQGLSMQLDDIEYDHEYKGYPDDYSKQKYLEHRSGYEQRSRNLHKDYYENNYDYPVPKRVHRPNRGYRPRDYY